MNVTKFITRALAVTAGMAAMVGTLTVTETRVSAASTCVITNTTSGGENTIRINYPANTDTVNGCDWIVPAGVTNLKVALVGGGGGAGLGWAGGGGGGGQVQYNDSLTVTPGQSFNVIVGQGGAKKTTTNRAGNSGTQTKFGTVTALGGGGGGGSNSFWYTAGNITAGMSAVGLSGGSGGGNNVFGNGASGTSRSTTIANSFVGWTAYGNPGGLAVSNGSANVNATWGAGSGGGGAYEAGTDSVNNNGAVTLGRGGRGILLLGACLGGGGESNYQGTPPSGFTYGASLTAQQACVSPDGLTTGGTSGALYQVAATANSGGGGGGYAVSTFADYYPGADGTVVIRYVVPTPTITSAATTNVQKPTISGTGLDGHTISVAVAGANYTATVAAGVWAVNLNTATPTSGTLALNVNGTNTVTASATNAEGGVSSNVTQTLTIDTTAPATPTLPSVPTLTNLNYRQINFTSEAGSSPQCSFDSGAYSACTSPYSTGTLSDGSHTLRVKTVDAAGNISAIGTYTWTLDTTAPNQPNIATTAAYQTTKSPTITFSADAGTTLTCKLDTNLATACTSSTTMVYSNLTEGAHTFTVFSADTATNASSRTYSFTVDTVVPTVPVITTTGAYKNVTSLSLAFTSDPTGNTQCSIDGSAFANCTSPYVTGTLTDGSHTFQVRGLDAAGNTSTSASYSWTQDTVAPAAPIISNSAQYIRQNYLTINYTRSAGTTTCQLDSNVAVTCSSATTHTLSGLADGNHTLRILTVDAAGNSSSSAYTFTVDTVAPSVAVFTTSTSITNSTSASISFTTDAGVTIACSLDGASFASCSSPYQTGTLSDGVHTLSVRSTDVAGNVSGTQTHTWTIDTIAPTAGTISNTAAYVANSSVTINFTTTEGVTTCQLDSAVATTCTSSTSMSLAGLSEGSHTFTLISTDEAGNISSSTYTFNVDTIAPNAPTKAIENAGPSERTSITAATFNFTSPAGTTTQCRLETTQSNAYDWTSCSSGTSLSSLALGVYRFSVRSVDAAGNLSSPTVYDWEVTPPGPAAPTIEFAGNIVTLSGAALGANGDRYEAKIVDANDSIISPWGTVSASFALRQSNGNYRVYARLVDDNETIGSVASLPVTITDQPAPASGANPRITIASNSGYSNQSSLGITIDWPAGTKNVKLISTQNSNNGNGTISSLATDWNVTNGHRGLTWNFTPAGVPTVTATHQLTAEFLDAAGAVINTQSSTVIIDVQAPTLTSAIPTAIDGSNLPIQVNAADESGGSGLAGVIITRTVFPVASAASFQSAALVEQEYNVVDGYVTIPNVTLGETMSVKVKDRAGNISTSSFTVSALNRQTLNPTAKFTGTAKVGQTLKLTPGTWPKTHRVTYQWLADGEGISGATKNTFKLTNAQAGKRITVAVTGTRATYYPIVVTTPASVVVTGGTLSAGTPTITGTTTVGQTLTANAGAWANNPNLTYVWKRGTTTIGNGLTYTLTNQDAGQKLTFTVTATKTGFNTLSKTATTANITGGTITEQAITITSALVKGKKVFTANTSAWSPSGVTLTYQWLKNGTPIARATAKTYTALPTDLGANLSVRITGTKTGFTTKTSTSLETLVQ